MRVLEVGPGMGYFTLALAGIVGPGGQIVCVDVQESMLRTLEKRGKKAGVSERIVTRVCEPTSLGLGDYAGMMDFALLFAMVHEVPDKEALFRDVASALRPGGRCLISEPRGHVSETALVKTLAIARIAGLEQVSEPRISLSRSAVLEKRAE
jgi:ubiquinone/menaquinone biosynthesis C-methylase UbiE